MSSEPFVALGEFIVYPGWDDKPFRVKHVDDSVPEIKIQGRALTTALRSFLGPDSDTLKRWMSDLRGKAAKRRDLWLLTPYGGADFLIVIEAIGGQLTLTIMFSAEQEREYSASRAWMSLTDKHLLSERCADIKLPEKVARDQIVLTGELAFALAAGRHYVDNQTVT